MKEATDGVMNKPAATTSSSTTSAPTAASTGASVYFYCSNSEPGGPYYVSDIFTSASSGNSAYQGFHSFLQQRYGPVHRETSLCYNFPTSQQAEGAKKLALTEAAQDPRRKIIETRWSPSTSASSGASPLNASSGVAPVPSGFSGASQSNFQFCETGATAENGTRSMYVSSVFSGPTDKVAQDHDIVGFREYVKQKFAQQQTFNTMCRFTFASSAAASDARTKRLAQLKSSRTGDPVVEADWNPALDASMIASAASASPTISSSTGVMPSSHRSADDAYVALKPLVFNTEIDGSLRATGYRQALVLLKQHPENIDTAAIEVTSRVLGEETQLRLDLAASQRHPNGTVSQFYPLEWSELIKSNPALATGPLLDVYLRPDADWSFLKQQPGWDDQKPAWVGVFLFPASAEQTGRDQNFAAHEVLPIAKQQIKDAAARESTNLFYDVPLGFATYDMDAQAIKFAFPFAAPLETLDYQKCFRLPTSGGEFQRPVGGSGRHGFAELTTWRDTLARQVSLECIILDHAPAVPAAIPMDANTAEATRVTHGQLTARVFVDLDHSQPVIEKGNTGPAHTYIAYGKVKRVEVLDPNHAILSSVLGASLPPPEAAAKPVDTPKASVAKRGPSAAIAHH